MKSTISALSEPIEQLRHLRWRALLIQSTCMRWGTINAEDMHLVMNSALMARRISRVIADWLNAHPNWRLHPRPNPLGHRVLGALSWATAHAHAALPARRQWLRTQFERVARESADIRAITSSRTINDMLAGVQPDVKSLLHLYAATEDHEHVPASA
jgi:hypothetical protein